MSCFARWDFQSMASNLFSNNHVVNQSSIFSFFSEKLCSSTFREIRCGSAEKYCSVKLVISRMSYRMKTFTSYPCLIIPFKNTIKREENEKANWITIPFFIYISIFFIRTGSFSKTTTTYNQFREGKPPFPTTRDKGLDKRIERVT